MTFDGLRSNYGISYMAKGVQMRCGYMGRSSRSLTVTVAVFSVVTLIIYGIDTVF
jgi:hypothetical protein